MCLSNREYVSCFQNLSNIILINPCCNELLYQAIFWLFTRHAWNLCDKEATCADWKGNVFPLDYTTGLGTSHRYSLCLCLSLHFCLASTCSTEEKEIISSTVDWTIIPIVCCEKCDIWGENLLLNITILFEHQGHSIAHWSTESKTGLKNPYFICDGNFNWLELVKVFCGKAMFDFLSNRLWTHW